MKPKGKSYEKKVIKPKVWETILVKGKKENVLVTTAVSKYIRELEKQIKNLKDGGRSNSNNK